MEYFDQDIVFTTSTKVKAAPSTLDSVLFLLVESAVLMLFSIYFDHVASCMSTIHNSPSLALRLSHLHHCAQ
jgi:hypothetical protein